LAFSGPLLIDRQSLPLAKGSYAFPVAGYIFVRQMKKLLAAILLLVYFTISTGFVVSLHYCMDRLTSTGIGSEKSNKCEYCGMHKDGKCCRDDVKIVKLQTTHMASMPITGEHSLAVQTVIATEFLNTPFLNFTRSNLAVAHGPPLHTQEIYIQNCVFRI